MKYTTLFTIEILHDYFENGRAGDVLFTPTPTCMQLLKGIKAFTKSWQNKLYVIVPTTPDGQHAAINLPATASFEFFWQPADAQFFSYTQWPLTPGHRYYCHNAVPSERAGKKYLHPLPPLHNPGIGYPASAMVSNGSQQCFEAQANLVAGNSLANTQEWANRGQAAYLTGDQQVACHGGIAALLVTPAASIVDVLVFGWNPVTNFPDALLLSNQYHHPQPVNEQPVDLRGFAAGLYRLLVNSAEIFCYIDPEENWQSQPGIISIHHHPSMHPSYALVDGSAQLLKPLYSIRLAPPQVIWQYKAGTFAVKKIIDEAGIIQFDMAPPLFTSQLPIRLQQMPYDKMMLEYNNTSPPDPLKTVEIKKLPAGSPMAFSGINKNGTNYLMATILLNY